MRSYRSDRCSSQFQLHSENGQFTPFIVICALFIVIAVGFVIDVGTIYVQKQQVQNAVDSTLIGVGSAYTTSPDDFLPGGGLTETDKVKAALDNTFAFNLRKLGLYQGGINPWPCVGNRANTYGRTDMAATPQVIAIDCNVNVPTQFMDLLSFRAGDFQFNPAAPFTLITSNAAFSIDGGGPLILLIVLDFSDSVTGAVKNKIRVAALEALYLLEPGDYVGITTFNEGYNGGPKNSASGWFTNVVLPFTKLSEKVTPSSTNDIKTLIDTKITPQGTRNGTYAQGGLYMARKMFRSIASATLDLPYSDYSKAIYFVSDGALLHSRYHAYPEPTTAPVTGKVPSPPCTPDPLVNACNPPKAFPPKVILAAPDATYPDPWNVTNIAAGVNLPSNLDLQLGWKYTCPSPKYSGAVAAREADMARREGVEVFSYCTACGHAPAEMRMRRIAADVNLNDLTAAKDPDSYNNGVTGLSATPDTNGDGKKDWYEWGRRYNNWSWETETEDPNDPDNPDNPYDPTSIPKCSGYGNSTNHGGDFWDQCWVDPMTTSVTCPLRPARHLVQHKRFWRVDPTSAAEEIAEAFKEATRYLKRGRLSE